MTAYLELLDAWARRVNLTGPGDAEDRTRVLVGDVVPLARHLVDGSLLDVGSGNGSPGLVLAFLRPDLKTTLLEPRAKRWAFLREAARLADRRDIEVLRARHDTYAGPRATNVSIRAVGLPLGELVGLVAPGGQIVVVGHWQAPPAGFGEQRVDGPGAPAWIHRACST